MTEFDYGNTAVEDNRERIYPKYKELLEAGVPEGGIEIARGTYTGFSTRTNSFDPAKTDITFYVDQGETVVGLNAAGNLKSQLELKAVEKGQLISVLYLGKDKIKKGPMEGRLAHNFVVGVAKS